MKRSNAPVDSVPYLTSVIPHNRLNFLAHKCRETLGRTAGNVIEVGVYRGGSLAALAQAVRDVCPAFHAIGVDTFAGHPYSDAHPVHPIGKYADVDIQTLRTELERAGLGRWVSLVTGRIEDILPSMGLKDIAFAHIDCDLYLPISFCARTLPNLMLSGGLLYFDDYGHEHCPGARRAVEELFPKERLKEVYMKEDDTCWSCFVEF